MLQLFVNPNEFPTGDPNLIADRLKSRSFDSRMVWHGQGSRRSVGITSYHGNVFSFSNDAEAERNKSFHHFLFRCVNRELAHLLLT